MNERTFQEAPRRCEQIAVVSDIHANGPALAAVLANLPKGAFLVCLGDLVGYYTEPEEVCCALRSRADVIIRGNHDAYAIGALGYPANRERAYRIQWTRNHLAGDTLDWLARLPVEASLRTRSGWRFVFRHANLDDEVGYVYPDTALNDSELDPGMTLVLGHTHHPMLRQAGRGRVLNPGSVGQPRDWRPGAAYALINTDNGQVTFHRVAYDIPAYQRRLREFGVEEELVAMLARQRADRRATAGDESGSAACIGREPTGLR